MNHISSKKCCDSSVFMCIDQLHTPGSHFKALISCPYIVVFISQIV